MIRRPVHPYWGIVEIVLFGAGFFSVIWIFGPYIGSSPGIQVIFWILVLIGAVHILWLSPVYLHQNDPKEWGLDVFGKSGETPGSFKHAWPAYAAVTIFGAVVLILYTVFFKPGALESVNGKAIAIKFAGYLIYGAIQTLIFFGFVLTRLREIISEAMGSDKTLFQHLSVVLLTSVIFSIFHTPNLSLMVCTFFMGFIWAWIFYKHPNLLLMALSHAILGTILHRVVQIYMRIGPFYENPDLYILREVIPGIKKLIGDLF